MMTLLIIQTVIFLSYVGYITNKFGILPSISDSWYSLPEPKNFLFTLFTWGIGIPMLFLGNFWFFLSGSGLCFVGAATQFRSYIGITKEVHYAGALIGILSSLVGIATMYQDLNPIIVFIVSAMILQISKVKNTIWWQEIVAFIIILSSLVYHL